VEDRGWFERAFVGVGHCSVPDDLSPSYTGKWVRAVLERNGYGVTSTFYSDNEDNDFSPDVAAEYNRGVNMVIVRGHQSDFNANDIQVGTVYPFHFMVSSSTISPGNGGAFNRTFRMGVPDAMRGPSAGFGHYPSPRTNIANAIVGGLTEALFFQDIHSFGWARQYLTAKIPIVMPADQGQIVTRYWGTLRYYGDPGQEPWVGVPRELTTAIEPAVANPLTNHFQVSVTAEGEPVANATVCLYMRDNLQLIGSTNSQGVVSLVRSAGAPLPEGDITITALSNGFIPLQSVIQVRPVTDQLKIERIVIGEGQPFVPAAETSISFNIVNRGAQAFNYGLSRVRLNSISPLIDLNGDFEFNQVIAVNGSLEVRDRFTVTALPQSLESLSIPTVMHIESEAGVTVEDGFNLQLTGADIVVISLAGVDNPRPGDDIQMGVTISDWGTRDAANVTAQLHAISSFIALADSAAAFGNVEVNGRASTDAPYTFRIAQSAIPGCKVELALFVEGEPGLLDTVKFSFNLSAPVERDPIGPDRYGYIAIESGDNDNDWAAAPEFNWMNVSPWGGDFRGDLLNFPPNGENDVSLVVDLPFTFTYYGIDYDQITVCNNGWIAVGDQTDLMNQQNWPMPGYNGAWGMIAPFWDRLDMNTRSDGVFAYYDMQGGRFVIQWQTGVRRNNNWSPNAFEVILYDPAQHQSATADSPILFQYNTVNDISDDFEANSQATVGISSPGGHDGLTYSYWGRVPAGARRLEAGRAILWTTVSWGRRTVVEGRVVRFIDSTSVAGADIRTSSGLTTVSNQEGFYRIWGETEPRITLIAQAEGYDDAVVQNVEITEGDTTRVELVLPHGWIDVTTDTLHAAVRANESSAVGVRSILNIGNRSGSVMVDYSVPDSNRWVNDMRIEFDEYGVIQPDQEDSIRFTATSDSEGIFLMELTISTNTPQAPIHIPVLIDTRPNSSQTDPIPTLFSVEPVYPNPFNSEYTIRFALPQTADVRITLYDASGRLVEEVLNRSLYAGSHSLSFSSEQLASGLYWLKLSAGERTNLQKAVLLR
jgi:hypothetical protein